VSGTPVTTNSPATCTGQAAFQFCTPGFWKNPKHFHLFHGAAPDQLFSTVCIGATCFEDAFPGKTVHEVLATGGGCLNRLGRFTVAMFLDAGALVTNFTQLQVIQMFNAVFPGTCDAFNALADQFEQKENCPLN